MLRRFLAAQIGRFEQSWSYDASYLRRLLAASPMGFIKFGLVSTMVPRKGVPADAIAAASLVATLAEDCGPCAQICVDQALVAGVAPKVLSAILTGDLQSMTPDAALAWRFARASLARDIEAADPLRDEILSQWGERGLAAVSLALTTARLYPTLKYALGYGKTCTRVVVGGIERAIAEPGRANEASA